jgi:hypothetical protein
MVHCLLRAKSTRAANGYAPLRIGFHVNKEKRYYDKE